MQGAADGDHVKTTIRTFFIELSSLESHLSLGPHSPCNVQCNTALLMN